MQIIMQIILKDAPGRSVFKNVVIILHLENVAHHTSALADVCWCP